VTVQHNCRQDAASASFLIKQKPQHADLVP